MFMNEDYSSIVLGKHDLKNKYVYVGKHKSQHQIELTRRHESQHGMLLGTTSFGFFQSCLGAIYKQIPSDNPWNEHLLSFLKLSFQQTWLTQEATATYNTLHDENKMYISLLPDDYKSAFLKADAAFTHWVSAPEARGCLGVAVARIALNTDILSFFKELGDIKSADFLERISMNEHSPDRRYEHLLSVLNGISSYNLDSDALEEVVNSAIKQGFGHNNVESIMEYLKERDDLSLAYVVDEAVCCALYEFLAKLPLPFFAYGGTYNYREGALGFADKLNTEIRMHFGDQVVPFTQSKMSQRDGISQESATNYTFQEWNLSMKKLPKVLTPQHIQELCEFEGMYIAITMNRLARTADSRSGFEALMPGELRLFLHPFDRFPTSDSLLKEGYLQYKNSDTRNLFYWEGDAESTISLLSNLTNEKKLIVGLANSMTCGRDDVAAIRDPLSLPESLDYIVFNFQKGDDVSEIISRLSTQTSHNSTVVFFETPVEDIHVCFHIYKSGKKGDCYVLNRQSCTYIAQEVIDPNPLLFRAMSIEEVPCKIEYIYWCLYHVLAYSHF